MPGRDGYNSKFLATSSIAKSFNLGNSIFLKGSGLCCTLASNNYFASIIN